MNRLIIALGLFVIVLCESASVLAQQARRDFYWKWGWGTYDQSADERNIANFDWSFIHVGGQVNQIGRHGTETELVQRLNRILQMNPRHKFVVLFWPLVPVRNKHPQFSLFDYLYNPHARKRLNQRIREQTRICLSIRKPQSIMAMTFLEELPGHVTSQPYANKFGYSLHDLTDNAKAIAAELGRPFDKAKDRRWWGRKYCAALAEIHGVMKKCIPHAKVFYWPAERYYMLDHVNDKISKQSVLPFRFQEILRNGLCEGIFGYINTPRKLQEQTIAIAEKYNVPYFTQLSQPAYMTIAGFPTCLREARRKHRLNLGSFLFKQDEVGDKRVQRNSVKRYLSLNESELLRTFCYENSVNRDIVVNRIVPPQVFLRCDFSGKRAGDTVDVSAIIYNQRNRSWFGMDKKRPVLNDLSITLTPMPATQLLTPARQTIKQLAGESLTVRRWKLQIGNDWRFQEKTLQARLTHRGLRPVVAVLHKPQSQPHVGMIHHVRHQFDRWLLIPPGDNQLQLQLQLRAISTVTNPLLKIGGATVKYRGRLQRGDVVTIGPGRRATYLPGNMLSQREANASRRPGQAELLSERYLVWGSQKYRVTMGKKYELAIVGRVTGGAREFVRMEYLGKGGNWNVLYTAAVPWRGKLSTKTSMQRVTLTVPKVAGKSVFARLLIYNESNQGKIGLSKVVLKKAGGQQIVTDRIVGQLPQLNGEPVVVQFADDTRAFAAYWRMRVAVRLSPSR